MRAVLMVAGAGVRKRWRSILVIGLVIGLAGGVVLTAFAGARRTSSAFDRLRTDTRAGHVTVTISPVSPRFAAQIGSLPGVASWAQLSIWPVRLIGDDYRPVVAAIDGRFGRDVDRSRLIAGRRARGSNELVLSESAAKGMRLGIGDVLRLATFTPEQADRIAQSKDEVSPTPSGPRIALRIVGIEQRTLDLTPIGEETGIIFVSADVYRAYRGRVGDFGGIVRVRLEPGEPTSAFVRRARAIAGERFLDFESHVADGGVNESLGILATGLLLFGLIGGLGAASTLAIISARSSATVLPNQPEWHALGLTRIQRIAAVSLPMALAVLGGVVLSGVVATVGSWFMPIGQARGIEPSPGLDVDTHAFVIGLGATLLIGAAITILNAVLVSRRSRWDPALARQVTRSSRSVRVLAGLGTPIATLMGVRMALETGKGSTAVPVRPALTGAAIGVLGIVAALVVGSSLDRLAESPRRYGWNFDAWVVGTGTSKGSVCGPASSDLESDPSIAAIASICFTTVTVGGVPISARGFRPMRGRIGPPMLRGRAPRADREIALGESTLDRIGLDIGDRVRVEGSRDKLTARIVGSTMLTTLDDPVSLSDGAVMRPSALTRIATEDTGAYRGFALRWQSGAPADAAVKDFKLTHGYVPGRPFRPAELDRLMQLNRLPWILSGFLALLALVAVGHAIATNARRRRKDFALLTTLGFRTKQTRATVATQAMTLVVVGLAVGIPLGIIAGRIAWRMIAENLGVATDAAAPVSDLAALVPLALLAVLAIAYLPARAVSRIRPAAALRSE